MSFPVRILVAEDRERTIKRPVKHLRSELGDGAGRFGFVRAVHGRGHRSSAELR